MSRYLQSSQTRSLSSQHPLDYLVKCEAHDVIGTIKTLWAMPYPADPILEPDLEGLTYGQVILYRQAQLAAGGDQAAVEKILDRLLGKPVMSVKSLEIRTTYQQYLDEIAKKEGLLDVESEGISQAETE
jgi:hypothetical protein